MEAIINAKRYNTEKAQLIGKARDEAQPVRSFGEAGSCTYGSNASLYITQKGSYFLLRTSVEKSSRNFGMSPTSEPDSIQQMTADAAYKWAENHLPVDVLEKWFAERIEEA